MADDPRLTPHDHLLAAALTCLVCQRTDSPERERYWRDMLGVALAKVSPHPRVAPLAAAARALADDPQGAARARALLDADAAVVAWADWRILCAQAAIGGFHG